MRVRRAPRWCYMCTSSKHGECELHINDGAVDAEEFISVHCACPCKGEVPEGSKLITLVADLRQQLEEVQAAYAAVGKVSADASSAHRALLRHIGEDLDNIFNDEGDGLQVSPQRNWLNTMRRMQDRYSRTLAEYPLDPQPVQPADDGDDEYDDLDHHPSPGID